MLIPLLLPVAFAASPGSIGCLASIEHQFSAVAATGTPLDLPARAPLASYAPDEKGSHHFQGIQRLGKGPWVITGSAAADVFVIDRRGRVVRDQADPSFSHAGGIQALGSYVGVGVETGGRTDGESRVVFYDLSRPMSPRRLAATISRPAGELPEPCAESRGPTAGAVALARRPDGSLLMIVGRWDSDVLDLYRSGESSIEGARFRQVASWCSSRVVDVQGQPARFGRYQALNLFVQCDGGVFLIGFETHEGRDLAALFRLTTQPEVGLTKLSEREFRCPGGCHFAAGAGASVEDGRLVFYSVEHRTRGRILRVNRFASPRLAPTSASPMSSRARCCSTLRRSSSAISAADGIGARTAKTGVRGIVAA
jgi:hypothetical protein